MAWGEGHVFTWHAADGRVWGVEIYARDQWAACTVALVLDRLLRDALGERA